MPNAYIVEKDFFELQLITFFIFPFTLLIGYLLFPKSILLAVAFIILVSTLLNIILIPWKYRTLKLDRIKIMEEGISIFDKNWNQLKNIPLDKCTRIILHAPKSYDKIYFHFSL
ncbi:MAG: hypothetical protein R2769_06130 [Saprospiraceae bacterium]